MLNRRGKNNENGSFDWNDALLDAGITAALTFFTALAGSSLFSGDPWSALGAAAVAAAGQFFAFLALKRGLRERKE